MEFLHSVKNLSITTQIKVEDLPHLAALGFKGIINTRFDHEDSQQPLSKNLEDEAKRLGIGYWHLPIPQDSKDITENQVSAFKAALQTIQGTAIVFCKTGHRSLELANRAQKTETQQMPSELDVIDERILKAMQNVIKFSEMKPNWKPALDGNPAWQIAAYKYTDGLNPNLCASIPPVALSEEFRLTTGVVEPGRGGPFHDHSGEELMFAARGSFVVFFDEEEKHKIYLEPWDAILIPPNTPRGWRNVGKELGCLLNISGINDVMTTL